MAQLIANPIYDSAFKYMMQNERAATVLLENLLDKEILKLDILTNDTPIVEEKSGVRILRLDFSAKVRDKNTGETSDLQLSRPARHREKKSLGGFFCAEQSLETRKTETIGGETA